MKILKYKTDIFQGAGTKYVLERRCECLAGEVLRFSVFVAEEAPRDFVARELRNARKEMRRMMSEHAVKP